MTAACADHARAERPDRRVVRQVIGIHGDAVIAMISAPDAEKQTALGTTRCPGGGARSYLISTGICLLQEERKCGVST
jgi:hypothetical protein